MKTVQPSSADSQGTNSNAGAHPPQTFLKPIPGDSPLAMIAFEDGVTTPEIVVVPVCAACRRPVLRPDEANFEAPDFHTNELLGVLPHCTKVYLVGAPEAFHLGECCRELHGPWMRAAQVIKNDQRSDIDRLMARQRRVAASPEAKRRRARLRREFTRISKLEPGLHQLCDQIRRVKDDGTSPSFCANRVWYGAGADTRNSFRNRMSQLVGWNAQVASLQTREAYDIAYQHLYDRLPPCRNCNCFGI
jgi:hypothetical protein